MNKRQDNILHDIIAYENDRFEEELRTDENEDYRRGFYAGSLFAALKIKNCLNDTEQLNEQNK